MRTPAKPPANVSVIKLAANRRNATKSTGPRTLSGKKASAMNATRHAALSAVPVLPGIEKAEEWEAHRSGTLASLAPVGYLETTLADRVASLLWRLGRVIRYETENIASSLETAEDDVSKELEDRHRRSLFQSSFGRLKGTPARGTTLTEIREDLEARTEKVKGFVYLRELEAAEPFPPEYAETVLREVAMKAQVELADVELPFLPPEADELGWKKWTGWTKGLVVRVMDAILVTTNRSHLQAGGAEEAWRACGVLAELDVRQAAQDLRDMEAKLQRSVRARALLSADGLEKVARYETHLERSLYRALHELQRLQAARTGNGGAPMAFDVDVSVGPRRDGDEGPVGSFRRIVDHAEDEQPVTAGPRRDSGT